LSKDDLVVWVCFIPFNLLVALQFIIIVSFFRVIAMSATLAYGLAISLSASSAI
jgi:uncharacterized membrane protein YagU involved in acid resistance